jgi:cobalt-precorrin 5A hydrolase
MGLEEIMIVAGIGCRRGTTAEEISAAIEMALAEASIAPERLRLIATSDGKGSEPGIIQASADRGVQLVLVRPADLEAAGPRTLSSSPRVKALIGIPSVAEAAALAACGPASRLVLPHIVEGPATCAIATDEDGS